jgi:redox-sensitive bicupin YhaK (pirin superfamily)
MPTHHRPAIEVRPAAGRFHTRIDWLDSWHSFSFGHHHDPANVRHGLLLVNNDDRVAPGGGFGTHPHRDMEIVTWVLSGELEHADTMGNRGIIRPGLAQRMSAGRGLMHSETNHSDVLPVHFVQMWVLPDVAGVEPGYQQADVSADLDAGRLVPVASGSEPDASVRIHQRNATLWAARLAPGQTVAVPDGPYAHVFVADGDIVLDGAGTLGGGDAARLTAAGSPDVRGGTAGAEVLVWVTGG